MYDYIEKLNPDNSLESMFYYTDTDSVQTHIKTAKGVDQDIGKKLGMLDNDLGYNAKIIQGFWCAPKTYRLDFIDFNKEGKPVMKNGSYIQHHIRGKGFSNEVLTKNLRWYEEMIFKNEQFVVPTINNFKKITVSLNSKQIEKGYSQFSTVVEEGHRTLNKAKWCGRKFLDDNPFISVPNGYNLQNIRSQS